MATEYCPNKARVVSCRVWCPLQPQGTSYARDPSERSEHIQEREVACVLNSRRARLGEHDGIATVDSELDGHLADCGYLIVNPIVVFVLEGGTPVDIFGLEVVHAAPPSHGYSGPPVSRGGRRRVLVLNEAVRIRR